MSYIESTAPIRVGVIGVGMMGERHARTWAGLPGATLVGVYDQHDERAAQIAAATDSHAFSSPEALLREVDAVCIASPTPTHARVAQMALEAGTHLLIEKPFTASLPEAQELIEQIARTPWIVVLVGHIERFNPVVSQLHQAICGREILAATMRRMQPYSTRCADTSVVNDLMIHDIDLALALFSDDIEQINAAGTAPMGGKLDHAISSLHGPDDLVITLIASRVSPTRLRSIEVHTTDAWIVADLINRSLTITPLPPMDDRRDASVALLQMTESPTTILTTPVEPLRLELQHFLNCIHGIERPMVDAVAGFRAMIFANTIEDLALRIARQENVEVVTPRRAAAERIAL